MARVRISNGPTSFEVDTDEEGLEATVASLLAAYREQLNVAPNAAAAVNGSPASGDTPLDDDDEVTFTKPTGSKGA